MSDLYCYVSEGAITPPPEKTIFVQGSEVRKNPFARPNAIGSLRVPSGATDDQLAGYKVFAIVITKDPKPGEYYVIVPGTPTVSGLRVVRHDTWRAMTAEEQEEYDNGQELGDFIEAIQAAINRLILIENNVVGANITQTQEAISDIAKYLRNVIRQLLKRVF